MAANVLVTPGSGDTIAAEDISSVKYQKVKLIDATASSTTGTGIAANPLQVSLANTGANSSKLLVTPDLPTGAATAAKQPALGTAGTSSADVITVQGRTSMTPLLTDGSGVTQPVSAASLPLPTGAATAAKQPALGTAGTASADVITVQGRASMTPLLVDGSGATQPISGSVTVTQGTNANLKADVTSNAQNLATVAKQPALGTAGSAATDVLTIQGIASMTKLLVTPDAITIASAQTLATVTTVGTVTTVTGGGVANASADSGNPLKVGGRALASPKGMTILADANRGDMIMDVDNVQIGKLWTSNADIVLFTVSLTGTTSTAVTGLGAVASTKNFITSITVWNASATNGYIAIQDGNGATTFWAVPSPTLGGSIFCPAVPLKQPTANTALYIAASTTMNATQVSIAGFQSKAY